MNATQSFFFIVDNDGCEQEKTCDYLSQGSVTKFRLMRVHQTQSTR